MLDKLRTRIAQHAMQKQAAVEESLSAPQRLLLHRCMRKKAVFYVGPGGVAAENLGMASGADAALRNVAVVPYSGGGAVAPYKGGSVPRVRGAGLLSWLVGLGPAAGYALYEGVDKVGDSLVARAGRVKAGEDRESLKNRERPQAAKDMLARSKKGKSDEAKKSEDKGPGIFSKAKDLFDSTSPLAAGLTTLGVGGTIAAATTRKKENLIRNILLGGVLPGALVAGGKLAYDAYKS